MTGTAGLAVLCPGQGGQHPAMFDLALASPRGAEVLAAARAALGDDPVERARRGGPDLFANALAQPLLCAAELATWAALREALPPARVFAGYSLGELAAYGCAGALSPGDTVTLAARRAALMDAAAPAGSGLLALRGIALARAEALAGEVGAELAIAIGPDHCVVGGAAGPLALLEVRARALGATTVQRLPVGVPAHTHLLDAAVEPFADALGRSGLRDPPTPVLAGVTGAPARTRTAAVAALSVQLARRVEWGRCLATAAELGCSVFLELGPGNALARMAAEAIPGARARSVADFRSLDGVVRWVEASGGRR
ncbi:MULTISPECIES: ACP S-malonyltransferase [Anaeromyxobacter]|uniref:ACP S-malonyltransferase n=1 Tax=Anaeromyxobacter TaxID=161492 RepID=UPI001F59650A|nr:MULTISPECIES: acyltransferase domain-containing protein [unclassified Anaeromyxobacter]